MIHKALSDFAEVNAGVHVKNDYELFLSSADKEEI